VHEVAPAESEPVSAAPVAGAGVRMPVRNGARLQRAAGNRAFARVLQRASQATALKSATDDTERASQLAGMAPVDMADTVLDPAAKVVVASAGLHAAVDALPAPGGPGVKAALRAATGPWDEPFYYSLGLLEEGTRNAIWDALKRTHPQLATATARSAAMNAALSGFARAGAIPDALKLLNGYSMSDMLDLLLYADGAGFSAQLKTGLLAGAPGIDPSRIEAAMIVVETRTILTVLAYFGIPLDARGQSQLIADLDLRMKGDQSAVADPATGAAYRERSQRGADALLAARPELERLFALLKGSVSPPDAAAMNAFVDASGIGTFRSVVNTPAAFTQGQFVLSAAATEKLNHVLQAQCDAITGLDVNETAALQAAVDGLNGALAQVYVGSASASYGRVAQAAHLCLDTFRRVASAHNAALTGDFRDALKQVIGAPKDGEAFNKAMERVWRPVWDQWLHTKAMPDMTRESNAYRLTWLKMADQWACQPMTMKLAELYDANAAGTANQRVDPSDPQAAAKRKAAAIPFTQLYKGTHVTKNPKGRVTDERVIYRGDLGGQVEKIRTALDLGWFVHVRVLSGVAMDYTSNRAAGEHSLLIVGGRGNAFFCSDADPGGEGSTVQMAGSTTLFYDAGGNTLATAAEEAMTVDESGHQVSNYRHRYQAWTIQTK
jgi:hypothetical protein